MGVRTLAGPSLTLVREMATTAELLSDPELLETEWDLGALVDDQQDDGVKRQLAEADERATTFSAAYAGKVAELDSAALADAMHELGEINELVGRAGSYSSLRFATDTADPARGALLALVQERATDDRDQAPVLRARVGRAAR